MSDEEQVYKVTTALLGQKSVREMSREDFYSMPITQPWDKTYPHFTSMVIVPEKGELHDSGYRCMSFVLCQHGKPFARVGGGSDVLHLEGIGGAALRNLTEGSQPRDPFVAWSIDCLPCGFLQLFNHSQHGGMRVGLALSSFEVYSTPSITEGENVKRGV